MKFHAPQWVSLGSGDGKICRSVGRVYVGLHSLILFIPKRTSLQCISLPWKTLLFNRWNKSHPNEGWRWWGKRLELVAYKKTPLKSAVWGSCWKSNICLGSLFPWVGSKSRCSSALHEVSQSFSCTQSLHLTEQSAMSFVSMAARMQFHRQWFFVIFLIAIIDCLLLSCYLVTCFRSSKTRVGQIVQNEPHLRW